MERLCLQVEIHHVRHILNGVGRLVGYLAILGKLSRVLPEGADLAVGVRCPLMSVDLRRPGREELADSVPLGSSPC